MRSYNQALKHGGVIMQSASSLKNGGGFSLIEILLMVLVVSMILLAVPASFRGGTELWEKGNRHNEVVQNALVGMEEMTRELRQATEIRAISPSGASNGYGYIDFRYAYDIDGDGYDIDGDGDREYKYQRYEYNGTEDYLQYAWSGNEGTHLSSNLNPLAGPVNRLTFTAYREYTLDEEGNTVEQLATIPDELDQIKSVRIKMITYDDQGKVNPIPLSTRVYLRNWIQRRLTDDFAIFGHTGVDLGDQPLVVGFYNDPSNVGANADIYIGNHTTIYGDVHHAAGSDIVYNNNPNDVHISNDYGYDEYITVPCVTDFTTYAAGPLTIIAPLADGETIDIDPGLYGHLYLNNNNTLNFTSAGDYYFLSIDSDPNIPEEDWPGLNNIVMNFDVTYLDGGGTGDIRVFVEGYVKIGNSFTTEFSVAVEGGGAENVYFEAHHHQNFALNPNSQTPAWSMGQNAEWHGTIFTPYGDIDITDGVIEGQLLSGRSIKVSGGSPSNMEVPTNSTMVDFVLSNQIRDYGYDCLP